MKSKISKNYAQRIQVPIRCQSFRRFCSAFASLLLFWWTMNIKNQIRTIEHNFSNQLLPSFLHFDLVFVEKMSETRPLSFGITVNNRITVELKRKTLPWPDSVISFFHLNIFLSKCRFHHFGFFSLSYLCYKSLSHRAESWHHFSLLSI